MKTAVRRTAARLLESWRRRRRVSVLALVGLALLLTGLAARRGSRTAKAPPAQASTTATKRWDWREHLDVQRASVRDGRLVQAFSDGSELTFTLHPDLQKQATRFLKSFALPHGAVVLLEVKTGNVLVMAGHSSEEPKAALEQIALTPWAPAASIYKLVTAASLLERGVPPEATVCYHGGQRGLQRHNIVDNPRIDRTCEPFVDGVSRSINPIMGKLALKHLDVPQMRATARRFGFNRTLPFSISVEPSRAEIPEEPLERARVAAGFRHSTLSPLHGALIAAIPATGGLLRWPRLVASVRHSNGRLETPALPAPEQAMQPGHAAALAKMMVATTEVGSGRRGFVRPGGRPYLPISVGGKTGSLSRPKPFLHYSWFVGFAPAHKPEVAVAVLLGNPARWRIKASTAARVILSQYLALRHPHLAALTPATRRAP